MSRSMTRSTTLIPDARRNVVAGAVLAVIGQVFFLGSIWILPKISGQDVMSGLLGQLVLGRYGYVQTAAYLVSGIGVLALILPLRRCLVPRLSLSVGVMLVATYGLGLLAGGILQPVTSSGSTDLLSWLSVGPLYYQVGTVSAYAMLVGMLLLTWAFSFEPGWEGATLASAFLTGASLTFLVVQADMPFIGILQRSHAMVVGLWVVVVALNALKAPTEALEPS